MAFMAKKKRYKFNVHCRLEELTDVPFVSAVLFAKVRLLDGKGFQEYSTREEVRDHAVRWNAPFEFVCKMCANANTGVLEPALLRISVRKECKGGRSYQKLGFCDVNLAELAGSGETVRRCLLEGYDPRRRQDNSVLRLRVRMDMVAGDPLFKVPSPSLKHRAIATSSEGGEPTDSGAEAGAAVPEPDDCASSVASAASSGFGSLTKKRTVYNTEHGGGGLSSLTTCEQAGESEPPVSTDNADHAGTAGAGGGCSACGGLQAHTHSRNSSNTSGDMSSKASGYGSSSQQSQHSRQSSEGEPAPPAPPHPHHASPLATDVSSLYRTPDCSVTSQTYTPRNIPKNTMATWRNTVDISRNSSDSRRNSRTLEKRNTPDVVPVYSPEYGTPETSFGSYFSKKSIVAVMRPIVSFQKHKSLNTLPDCVGQKREETLFHDFPFLTPLAHRKGSLVQRMEEWVPSSWHTELIALHTSTPETARSDTEGRRMGTGDRRPEAGDRRPETRDRRPETGVRRPVSLRNPSGGSLAATTSESGSLDRGKPHARKHKSTLASSAPPSEEQHASTRVENTRVNPDSLIDELLKATNLEQAVEDSAETSGLQLFIARDGTAALGSRQVKQQPRHNYQRVVVQPAGADHR